MPIAQQKILEVFAQCHYKVELVLENSPNHVCSERERGEGRGRGERGEERGGEGRRGEERGGEGRGGEERGGEEVRGESMVLNLNLGFGRRPQGFLC